MRKIFSLILVCGIMLTIFAGCGAGSDSENIDELTPASSVSMGEDQAGLLKDKTPFTLYFINEQGTKLSPETRYIDNNETAKGTGYLATVILQELISGPAQGSLLMSSIPKETKVHSDVTIKNGVATVDLSKEFVDKHPGGKKSEQLTLYSIVNTLTELKDITSVQFKIDGKVKKEFKGSYQLDIALPRSAYLNTALPGEQDVSKIENQDTAKENQNKQQLKQEAKPSETKEKLKEETKPSETKEQIKEEAKPSETKPSESKPSESKPSEIKPDQNKNQQKDDSSKDMKTNADVEIELDPLE